MGTWIAFIVFNSIVNAVVWFWVLNHDKRIDKIEKTLFSDWDIKFRFHDFGTVLGVTSIKEDRLTPKVMEKVDEVMDEMLVAAIAKQEKHYRSMLPKKEGN